MFSPLLKLVLVLLGLSPALLSLYIAKIIREFPQLSLYIESRSVRQFFLAAWNLVSIHYLILLFILLLILTKKLIKYAIKNLPVGRIDVKSIKPADVNFITPLFSVILPLTRLYIPSATDAQFLIGFSVVAILYAFIARTTYHFNLVLRSFLGYIHYEIQTTGEVTYLLITKKSLINKNDISQYIYLTDHMLLNVKN